TRCLLRDRYSSGSEHRTSTPDGSTPASSHASRSAAATGPSSSGSMRPPGNAGWPAWLFSVAARSVSSTSGPSGPSPKRIRTAAGLAPGSGRNIGGTGIRGPSSRNLLSHGGQSGTFLVTSVPTSRSPFSFLRPGPRASCRTARAASRERPRLDELARGLLVGRALTERRAQVREGACAAGGTARMADAAAVPDQPVRQHRPLLAREQRADLLLDLHGVVLGRPPEPPGEASEVGVDRDSRDVERVAQDDVGRLAPDPGQGDQVFQPRWDLAIETVADRGGQSHDRLRLGAEEPGGPQDGLDV